MVAGTAAAAVLLTLGAPGQAAAQERISVQALRNYGRVQIWAPALRAEPIEGPVRSADSLQLVLGTWGRHPLTVAADQIQRVQVREGRGKLGAGLLGFSLGLLAGLVGVGAWESMSCPGCDMNGVVAVVIGAPVGALVGTLIGAVSANPRWIEVEVIEW